jgi:hypothetical protein
MEAGKKRMLQSGLRYESCFPKASHETATIRKEATVEHTIRFIPKVVQDTTEHTKQIAKQLQGKSLYETCNNIWQFVYQHIGYRKDAAGYEQIRSPARTWQDRQQGVDCDCYSVFISSILTNLGITHTLRITKYGKDYFQHIYPIVPTVNKHITMDCVTDQFDYEVPYSEKKDYPMDLQYLSGFDGDEYNMGDLGKLRKATGVAKKQPITSNKKSAKAAQRTAAKAKRKEANAGKPKGFKKVLNIVNKVNPATVLLRNGILASMKLNIKNVAGRLRWSYLTAAQATDKNIHPQKFQQLIATRQKLENIFYKTGGKVENLRKAIISGKGNKDRAVNGVEDLEGLGDIGRVMMMNEHTPIEELLGYAIHQSENIEGMEGYDGLGDLGELGEPLTLSSIAAASGVIAGIVGMLKQIGDIFQKKTKGSEDFDEQKNEQAEREAPAPPTNTEMPVLPIPSDPTITSLKEENYTQPVANQLVKNTATSTATETIRELTPQRSVITEQSTAEEIPSVTNAKQATEEDKPPDTKPGFWDANKKWLKPVAIGVGGLGLIVIGMNLLKSNKPANQNSKTPTSSKSLHGIPKKKRKNHHRKHTAHHPKKSVALL